MRINSYFKSINGRFTDLKLLSKCLASRVILSFLVSVLLLTFSITKAYSQEDSYQQNKTKYPEHLSDKFYRQALYFYFQNKPDEALEQLNINNEYFLKFPVHANLFKVGLQISQGLPQHAQTLLEDISEDLSRDANKASNKFFKANSDHDIIESNTQKEELMLIVLLLLAEKKIEQQDNVGAQSILDILRIVPSEYLSQYYLLQQLIAWPQQPNIEDLNLDENSKNQLTRLLNNDTKSPYILLNEAIGAMNEQGYVLAEQKLTALKTFSWNKKSNSFWQQLFSEETEGVQRQVEQSGINHYAQLLLAQLYIEQGYFKLGYEQLESFPQHTSFTEQALFLFGYSAFKLRKFTVSEIVLNKLITDHPYSTFTQQGWALSAQQYIVQNKLDAALEQYLLIEQYYEKKAQELASYKVALEKEDYVLNLYQRNLYQRNLSQSSFEQLKKTAQAKQSNQINQASKAIDAEHSLWINASLKHAPLAKAFKQLLTVDALFKELEGQQVKSDWLATTIELNNVRQQKIKENQNQRNYSNLLQQLADKKKQLSALLVKAKSTHKSVKPVLGNSKLFANVAETHWLKRIENSKNALAIIKAKSDKNTEEYEQRLKRVNGVLTWQLHHKFPERFWQSQQALNEFEKLYNQTKSQYKKVNDLLLQENVLTRLSHKQQSVTTNITTTLEKTQQLKAKLNNKLLTENQLFIKNEERNIQQYLLFNQRAMAIVIESLNKQEAL